MSRLLEDVKIDQLSVEERLELIGDIWDSFSDSGSEISIPEWHKKELKRRIAELDADPASRITRDELNARLRRPK